MGRRLGRARRADRRVPAGQRPRRARRLQGRPRPVGAVPARGCRRPLRLPAAPVDHGFVQPGQDRVPARAGAVAGVRPDRQVLDRRPQGRRRLAHVQRPGGGPHRGADR